MGQTFFVRAMSQTEKEFDIFFKRGVVAVGWSSVNFSKADNVEQLLVEVENTFYGKGTPVARQVVGKKLNEVRRFKLLNAGDKVIVPYYTSLRLAIVEEAELYDATPELDGDHLDLANQRKVRYLKIGDKFLEVPRASLSEGLQRRLRVRGTTIASLNEFSEVHHIFEDPTSSWRSRFATVDRENAMKWQRTLLNNIWQGKTNLQSGGFGLEKLIRDLLRMEGYQAEILSKRRFPGIADADVEAIRTDLFSGTKLFIQVKHHNGQSDAWGAKQLEEIFRDPEASKDYEPVLVTTADASKDLRDYCEDKGIKLITGRDLVDSIYVSLERLSAEWREVLGIGKTGEFLNLL